MKSYCATFVLLLASVFYTKAFTQSLTLGPLFTDHAILQQGRSVPVWGTAVPKAKITVAFGKAKAKAVADSEGRWKAVLPAQEASFEGKALTVKAGKEQITLYKSPKDKERQTGSMLRWFEVAGSDGIWHAATAYVEDGEHVVVSSPSVQHPVGVRYLWHETATSNDLCNSLGLPAFPFVLMTEK